MRYLWVALIGLYLALSLRAELPRTRLDTIFPFGARRGTEIELRLAGADLDEASQVLISAPGVTTIVTNAPIFPVSDQVTCRVSVATNALPGFYEVRVQGRFGVSTSRTFVVGDLPEVINTGSHHSSKQAMVLPVPCIVNGRAETSAIHYYRFTAKQGQKFTVECQSQVIDSRLEPDIILTDMAGLEMERGRRGTRLQFLARQDGDYLILLHDSQFRGGAEYGYRLEVSLSPRYDFALPLAINSATNQSPLDLFGYNISDGKPATNQVYLGEVIERFGQITNSTRHLSAPSHQNLAEAFVDSFDYWPLLNNISSDPVRLLVSPSTNILRELEPNDRIETAQLVTVPCEISGQFYPNRDRDGFQFLAKKGEVYFIEIVSQRLGLPTAPIIVTQRVTKNDKGEWNTSDLKDSGDQDANYGGVEFNTSTRDPLQRFEVPEDGTYRVMVRNRFDFGEPQPRLVYHLIIRKPQPDFRLLAWAMSPIITKPDTRSVEPWSAFLRRDDVLPIKVAVQRRDGFNEPIHIVPIGLPAGVSFIPTIIPPDNNSTTLYLSTSSAVTNSSGILTIQGQSGDRKHTAKVGQTLWAVGDYNLNSINTRLTRDGLAFAVSAREQSPVTVFPTERKLYEVAKGGKISLPMRIDRHGEFSGILKIRALVDPVKDFEVPANATNAVLDLDLSQTKLVLGTNKVELLIQVSGRYQRFGPEALKASEDEVKQAQSALDESAKKATEAVSKEKENPEAAAKAKDLTSKKDAAAKRVEELKQRTQSKDVSATCYAEPFLVLVK